MNQTYLHTEWGEHHATKIKSEWNRHAKSKWTYFNEGEKQLISYWLAERLEGNNVELGGGWYLSVPGSVVIDVSEEGLKNNPAEEKYVFNFDELADGKQLPIEDHRFHSATMISVWQYILHPEAFLKECERILKPGGKLYIINGAGAGLQDLITQPSSGTSIAEQISKLGYSTLTETLPVQRHSPNHYQSVCVQMPDHRQLELPHIEKIAIERVNEILDITDEEYDDDFPYCKKGVKSVDVLHAKFIEDQFFHAKHLFSFFQEYPVTEYSMEVRRSAQEEARKYGAENGCPTLLWTDVTDLEFDMLQNEADYPRIGMTAWKKKDAGEIWSPKERGKFLYEYYTNELIDILLKIECGEYSIIKEEWGYSKLDEKVKKEDLSKYIVPFLSRTPLNDFTRQTQEMVYGSIKRELLRWHKKQIAKGQRSKNEDNPAKKFEAQIQEQKIEGYYQLFMQHKQERRISKYIERKKLAQLGQIPIVAQKSFHLPIDGVSVKLFKERIAKEIGGVFQVK